jgi:lipoprotein-releasing system ATP-binding protein
MSGDIVLEAKGLGRRFTGSEGEIVVLEGAELAIRRGEVVGIVGASGVGKSTLLHILGSLDRPDEGTVLVGGEDVHALSGAKLDRVRNEYLGFVFQFHFLLPEFTALENVMMPLLVAGRQHGAAARTAQVWLSKVGLSDRSGHRPSELSGGEQQRVAVARALVNEPAVVLADEPTGNLDDATGDEVHSLIRTLADEENKTFVVVTHKRSFAKYADRVLLLSDRRLAPLET